MKRLTLSLLLAATFSLVATQGQAAGDMPDAERLFVGKTNIHCMQAPCPWRGIWRAGDQPPSPSTLLWAGDRLPRILANRAVVDRITSAWEADECVEVRAIMIVDDLHVERVAGACR